MRKLNVPVVCMLVLAAGVAGCGYERGFEYMTESKMMAVNDSGVAGSVVLGYGMENPTFRMRVALGGLDKNVKYHVRFFNASSCSPTELANARRIDAKSDDPDRKKDAWGFEVEPALVSGNFLGRAEQEFKLSPPTAPSIYSTKPDKYPTIVIAAADKHVACGTITEIPTNRRPHM